MVAITKLGTTKGNTEATESTLRRGMFDLTVNHASGTATTTEITVTKAISKKVRPNTAAVFGRHTISIQSDPALIDLANKYATGINAAIATTAADAKRNAGGRFPSTDFHTVEISRKIVTQTSPGFQRGYTKESDQHVESISYMLQPILTVERLPPEADLVFRQGRSGHQDRSKA